MSNKEQIHLILQAIKDIEERCDTFINYEKIPQIEIDLTLSKIRSIYDSVLILDKFNKTNLDIENDDSDDDSNFEISNELVFEEEYVELEEDDTLIRIEDPALEVVDEPSMKIKNNIAPPNQEIDNNNDGSMELVKKNEAQEEAKSTPAAVENTPSPASEKDIAPQKKEPEIIEVPTPPKENKTQAAKAEQLSVNDKIAKSQLGKNLANKIQNQPIENISKAIGLNDKFQFIRELFGGLSDEYSKTVESLNDLGSFEEATLYIEKRFKWDFDDPTVVKFLELINRRYLNK